MYSVGVPTSLAPEEHGQGEFTLYRLAVQAKTRCRVSGALPRTMSWSIDKRYSDFVNLRQALARVAGSGPAQADVRALPALPPKVWLGSSLDPALVETRRAVLEQFFQRLVLIPAASQLIAAFVEQPAELLMSSDEDEAEDEEEAAQREQRRRLAVLAEAERLHLKLYGVDAAVATRELLDFVLQNADTSFLKNRRLGSSAQQDCHTLSRGRVVRAFKRLVEQLRCDSQPAAAAPTISPAADRAKEQPSVTKWHHTRRRLPTTGWCHFTDAESIEAYYHGSMGFVTYEHVMLAGKLDRIAELRKEIEHGSALRVQGFAVVQSTQRRELDAELADAEREAARVAEAVRLEAEVNALRRQRVSGTLVPPADLTTESHDLQQQNRRTATSTRPAVPMQSSFETCTIHLDYIQSKFPWPLASEYDGLRSWLAYVLTQAAYSSALCVHT